MPLLMLSGMIFEKIGDYDDAIIDYRRALKAYQNGYTDGSVPRALIEGFIFRLKKEVEQDCLFIRERLPFNCEQHCV